MKRGRPRRLLRGACPSRGFGTGVLESRAMTEQIVKPARGLVGTARLPGDKSISHRLALLGALAEGATTLENYSTGDDCRRTLDCLAALGGSLKVTDDERAGRRGGVGRWRRGGVGGPVG